MAKANDILDSLSEPEIRQFPDFCAAVRELAQEHGELLEALKDLLAACEDDCGAVGDLAEFDGDDEPVGGGLDDEGNPEPMALTFGHLRRAAQAIAKATASA
jgi:hypothetical protein